MTEAPEGIVFKSSGNFIDLGDLLGKRYTNSEILGLSKSQIETMDIISEGPIGGLISGSYSYSGNLGEIGWRTATFSGFSIPTGYTGIEFLRSIYWNETPVLNDIGQFNFQSVNVKQTIGKPNGEAIQVLSPYQTISRTLGERLISGPENAKIYRIYNKDCRAVMINIKFPSLSRTDPENGNIKRVLVTYSIYYKPIMLNGNDAEYALGVKEEIFGKVTANGYIRTSKIDFDITNLWDNPNFLGWEIKIERLTPESTTSLLNNRSYIDSITEIQGNIYTFPNSAVVRSLFDAEFFQSVPERAFDAELLKVKIPGNYDPRLKTYSETGFGTSNSGWNGEFKTGLHWTDNPAWCFYDLLTNKRYGLGKYIEESNVDKVSLYKIGQYCDTLVADGFGGLEPRFTCNLWITTREEAYKVMNDMSSVFRGLAYYANGSIFATQDSKKDSDEIITAFTNANVKDGNFNYSTTSKRNRHSVAIIRYNDPKNFYRPAIEYVEDFDAIRKFGIREIELTAFGCTSRGQAIRLGRWVLLSDNLEPESINFTAGLEANYLRPGVVFKVFDSNRKTKRYGGRVLDFKNINSTGTDIILDYKTELEPNIQYTISFITPSYNYDPTQVSGTTSQDFNNIRKSFIQKFSFSGFQAQNSGNKTVLNLYSGVNYNDFHCSGNPTWIIELDDNYSTYTGKRYFTTQDYDYYRVINIKEKDVHEYEIEGLQYNPQKFIEIESGLLYGREILSQTKVPSSPYNLNFNVFKSEALTQIDYSFLVDDYSNIQSFKVYVTTGQYANNGVPPSDFLTANLPATTTNGTLLASETGTYNFRVYSSNDANNILSPNFASGSAIVYDSDPIQNVIISSLEIDSVTGLYSGAITNGNVTVLINNNVSPNFVWQVGFSNSVSIPDLFYRVTVREFDDSRVPSDSILYEATGITTQNWQFDIDRNISLNGGPYRDYQIVVEAHDSEGYTSAGNRIGTVPDVGWAARPNGYDIIAVQNLRQSGIELSNNLPTQLSGITFYYTADTQHASIQYLDANGNITIKYTTGQFDSDLVGGFLYTSTIPFPKTEIIQTGDQFYYPRVQRTRFSFNPLNPYIYIPTAAFDVRGAPFIYGSISFFDELDEILLDRGVDIAPNLYISNNALFFNDNSAGSLSLGGITTLGAVQTTGYPAANSARLTGLIGSGSVEIGRTSTSGIVNQPGNITTIFYMTKPITGLGYTGFGGGAIDSNRGGLGAASSNNISVIPYGGFLGDSLVATSTNDSFQTHLYTPISGLQVGSSLVAWQFNYGFGGSNTDGEVYNYSGDNWRTSANKYTVAIDSFVSGFVDKFEVIDTTGYYKLTFTGSLGKYIYLNMGENQVLALTNNGLLSLPSNVPTGYFFRRAKDIHDPLTLATNIPNSYIFSGKEFIEQTTKLYCINVSPYNTFQISGAGNPIPGYEIRPTYVHDSIFNLNSIYNY